jgi:DNA-binding FrmR family transcriptional regulator
MGKSNNLQRRHTSFGPKNEGHISTLERMYESSKTCIYIMKIE